LCPDRLLGGADHTLNSGLKLRKIKTRKIEHMHDLLVLFAGYALIFTHSYIAGDMKRVSIQG